MLVVDELTVEYQGAIRALRQVSITVADAEVVALVGNNGAGKTTLLRAVSQNLEAHRGRAVHGDITFDGRSLRGWDRADCVRAGLVQVPEGRRIFGTLTVEENLKLAAAASGHRRRTAAGLRRVYELFPSLGERRGQRGLLLSGGEQQMLALGRALVAEPKLLMLDEPSLGLAPRVAAQIVDVIEALQEAGVGVLLVEQNAALALSLSDRAYVLELGEVSLAGASAELRELADVRRLYLGGVVSHEASLDVSGAA